MRRSRRLAAKPRINYEEEELEEEEKKAAKAAAYAEKEAFRAAKKAAVKAKLEEARAEYHKIQDEFWKKHKDTIDDYRTSCESFRKNEVWKRPDCEEMAAHRALKAKYLEVKKELRSAPLVQAQKRMFHMYTRFDRLK